MATSGQGGFGLQFKLNGTAVANVLDIDELRFVRFFQDITGHDAPSGYDLNQPDGRKRIEPFRCVLGWEAEAATHAAIISAFDAHAASSFELQDPDSIETITFSAHIEAISRIAMQDGAFRAETMIHPVQQPTLRLPYKFSLADTTFTAKMAKRVSVGGPFTATPIIQNAWDGSGSPDALTAASATISGQFKDIIDLYQGTIVFFWTPEFSSADLSDTRNRHLFKVSSNIEAAYEVDNNRFWVELGGQTKTQSYSVTAGTPYMLTIRWDTHKTLDGTNYCCLSIGDTHYFFGTSAPIVGAAGTLIFGADGSGATPIAPAANALLEGFTIYRRLLWDGSYGTNVGNGDEIAAIYNSGTFKDPTRITGSWDVCFCMPCDASPGELAAGTGEAWSHPHSSSVLADSFCQTTYGSSGWVTEGSPATGPADIASASNKIFQWGYQWTASAFGAGIKQTLSSLTAGTSYILRIICHVDGASRILFRLTDVTNSAILHQEYIAGSTSVSAPEVFAISFELPTVARNGVGSDCTSITVSLVSENVSTGQYLHQFELYEQLVDNPSFEQSAAPGDPWIPDGWTNFGTDTGDTQQETTTKRSGTYSIRCNTGFTGSDGFRQAITVGNGNFVMLGGFFYGDGSGGFDYGGTNLGDLVSQDSELKAIPIDNGGAAAQWNHLFVVMRQKAAGSVYCHPQGESATGPRYMDCLYALLLDNVTLGIAAVSQANSLEGSGIRIDGRDTLTQPIPSGIMGLGAIAGSITFDWTPRHGSGAFEKFGDVSPYSSSNPVIVTAYKDASNYILLQATTNSILQLTVRIAATSTTGTWSPGASDIVAGTTYQIKIQYDAVSCKVYFDDVLKITAAPAGGIDFGANVPTLMYWGSYGAAQQFDAVYADP